MTDIPLTTTIIPADGWIIAALGDIPSSYAVYECSDHLDRLMYIGLCKLMDVYTLPDARDNSEFMKHFPPHASITIKVVAISRKLSDTINHRARLVNAMRPHCNIYGKQFQTLAYNWPIRCNETGETFDTMSDICRAHNCAQSAISNHLAGKPGHRTVKGRTYRRIDPDAATPPEPST